MKKTTSLSDFRQLIEAHQKSLTKNGVLVPIIEEHLADMDTPVSIFSQIKNNKQYKDAFILESVDGESDNSRYCFIGFNPFLKLILKQDSSSIEIHDKTFDYLNKARGNQPPLQVLKEILEDISILHPPDVPRLLSGAVGYLGYDSIRLVEDIPFSVNKDQHIPLGVLGFYNTLIIFDNLRKTMMFISAPLVKKNDELKKIFTQAKQKIQSLTRQFSYKNNETFPNRNEKVQWSVNMDRATYENIVELAKEYIKAGDIFQVVLSQRFQTEFKGDAFQLYRALRIINPSPYLYYIDFGDLKIIGSSPELLVRIDKEDVYTRPIAGTRPRGSNTDEDVKLEQELMADKKELAEHLMLVDLGRNDLGRVCNFGSVHVSRMMKVEKYSHVMHIVSDVTGKLNKSFGPVDALYAAFPAGTLSGAPKIRAMEIIDELEPTERAIYGGAIGYFDFGGNMDWCIAIRTIIINGDKLTIQAGAGIVADSQPDKEFEETINKSQALKTAVEWVGTKKV